MVETTTNKYFLMTTPFVLFENSSKEFKDGGIQDGGGLTEENKNDMGIWEQNLTEAPVMSSYPVEASTFTEFTAGAVLIIGLFGNIFGICVFTCHPSRKKQMVLDKIVTFLCCTGLTTTIITTPLHLYASKTRTFPTDTSLCQIQGLLLNLLCLISLWYTAVLATERFFRLVSPHEHRLTFSPLNLNVILAGVFVLLVVEVSGPIYGWAEYGFLNDSTVCLLNPDSSHIFTYSMIHVACYVALPVLITLCFTCYVIRHGLSGNERLSNGSQVLKTGKGIVVLCIGMLLTMLLLLPYHATLILQAMLFPLTIQQKVIGYWLHIIGITCVYPMVLLMFGRKEILPVLKFFFNEVATSYPCSGFRRRQKSDSPDSEGILVVLGSTGGKPKIKNKENRERVRRASLISKTTEFTILKSETSVETSSTVDAASGNL